MGAEGALVSKETHCPKCSATLPRRGRFCIECGLDLYREGIRRSPFVWLRVGGCGLVALLLAVLVLNPFKPPPPEKQAVELTKQFLELLKAEDYGGIVERFYKPDTVRFRRVEDRLWEITCGEGAHGLWNVFGNWRLRQFNGFGDARDYVEKHGARHRDYVAALLYAVAYHLDANGKKIADPEQFRIGPRAQRFYTWYLRHAFRPVDLRQIDLDNVEIRLVNASPEPGPGGEDGAEEEQDARGALLYDVRVIYPSIGPLLPDFDDPTLIRWRYSLGNAGGCRSRPVYTLTLGGEDRLDDVLEFLKPLQETE